jgi:hypothetical protein
VDFDGHSGKVRLLEQRPVGTEIHVLYLPEKPEVAAAGERGDSLLTLFYGRALESNAWDGLMCMLSCGWLFFVTIVIVGIEQGVRCCRELLSQ